MRIHRVLGVIVVSLVAAAVARTQAEPYFRMVPVQPLGANADPYPVGTTIDEQTGTISFPGFGPQRVWIEVRYGDWDSAAASIILYQWSTVYLSDATGGVLQKTAIPCTPGGPGQDDFCRGELGVGPPGGTGCRAHPSFSDICVSAFPEWVGGAFRPDFLTELDIFAADVSEDRVRFGQVANTGGGGFCAVDDSTEKYSATFVVETTAAVGGSTDIPVDFDPSNLQTFIADCASALLPDPLLTGATIQFRGDECTSDAHCDDSDPCSTDTCNLGTGACGNTPIPGCPDTFCTIDAHCNDGESCTTDTCDVGTGACVFSPIPGCGVPDPDSSFTYQGFLENPPGSPVKDTCALRFGLWDDGSAGALVGVVSPLTNPLLVTGVVVSNGSFTTMLGYGPGAINGDPRWLEIEVQCSGDPSFVMLSPRVPLLPTPYALRALEGVGPPEGLHVTDSGDVGIGLSDPIHPLEMASGAHVTAGGVWTNASSRALKENFADVDPLDVLSRLAQLPIQLWNYRSEDDTVRHFSPMAEEFYAAFGLGGSDSSIGTIDADGVALAAIQGLNEVVQEKDCEIEALRERNRALELRLQAVEDALDALSIESGKEIER